MQKARRHPLAGGPDRSRAHGFRVSFTPLRGVLFTFPSRYWFAIGLPGVVRLAGWSRPFRAGVLGPRPTQGSPPRAARRRLRASHPLRGGLPAASARGAARPRGALLPRGGRDPPGLGDCPSRSPLRGAPLLSPPPPATGMFRFAGCAPPRGGARPSAGRVAPFGHPGVTGPVRLARDFRS